jgi:hypothetical protein
VATPLKPMTSVPLMTSSPVVQSEKGSLQPASAFPTNSLENNISPIKNDSALYKYNIPIMSHVSFKRIFSGGYFAKYWGEGGRQIRL